jgi:hypothetical protein
MEATQIARHINTKTIGRLVKITQQGALLEWQTAGGLARQFFPVDEIEIVSEF